MTQDVTRLLGEIEERYGAAFSHNVRIAIEARAWLLRCGLPFTSESLLRTILRDGFDKDSAFRGLDVRLTHRAPQTVLRAPGAGKGLSLSPEVVECLETAGRISQHFSRTRYISGSETISINKGHIGQDAIVFAVAYLAPELITSNLTPVEGAEWIRKTARGVARRALSERIGPSTMYNLRELEEMRNFLAEHGRMVGWHLKTLLARSVATGGDQYVFMSASEEVEGDEVPPGEERDEAPGRHASLCFIGVPPALECPNWGELSRPVRIESATFDAGEEGRRRFILRLDAQDAAEVGVEPTVTLEFAERMTVEEFAVAPPCEG